MTNDAHKSSDGYPIKVGAKFWNNDLRVVQVKEVAVHSNDYASTGETQTWHQTTNGQCDSLSGNLQKYGRLVRHFYSDNLHRYVDAEAHPIGTYIGDTEDV